MGRLRKVTTMQMGAAQVSVWSDIEALNKQVKKFGRNGVDRAAARALLRSANKAKTFTGRLLSKDYNIKTRSITKALKISPRPTPLNQTVAIMGRGPRLPIYKHTKNKPKQTPLGVRYNAGGGRRVHAHQFIATMPSGHIGIFVRAKKRGKRRGSGTSRTTGVKYKSALAIRELTYPAIAHMITNTDRGEEIFKFFTADYPKQLHSQLDFELKKSKGVG